MRDADYLVALCKKKGFTVSGCESMTAGLFTAAIASVPGASSVLKGGIVTYFTEIKEKVVHVESDIIHTYGVISDKCAASMASHTREIMDSDYCVSFTGNAGPDIMEDKPAGTVYCAIASKQEVKDFYFHFEGLSRNELRNAVVEKMIEELIDFIEQGEIYGS